MEEWHLLVAIIFFLRINWILYVQSTMLSIGNEILVLFLFLFLLLLNPFYLFHPVPQAPSPLTAVSHFLSVSEIIRYFSFSDCLISLSIMFSRSIHAGPKDKFFVFLRPSSIPSCKCAIVALCIHPLVDAWAASISW